MADQVQGVPVPPPPAPVQAGQQAQQQQQKHPTPLAQHGKQILQLPWSYFKPEFSGKPDEDAEVHQVCTNDWMTAHHFVEGVKGQRFCLTLLGEASLWYHSLEPIHVDRLGLQNLFTQQYSKTGNTREQLFMCGNHLVLMKTQKSKMHMLQALCKWQLF